MTDPVKHSRRSFLQGQAAVRTVVDAAAGWIDSAAELLSPLVESSADVLHLQAHRRAMACDFELLYHADDDHRDDDGSVERQHEDESQSGDSRATEAALEALDLIESLEAQMTIYRDHSEVIAINNQAADHPVEVEPRLFGLLQLAQTLHRETQGAFDLTTGPLLRAWGFLQREGRLPSEAEIRAALDRVGGDRLELDHERLTICFLDAGVEINLNAIGKGYALDRAAELLDERGLSDYLWHGGRSSVLARGCNRADARAGWTIGLPNPEEPGQLLGQFHLHDGALATAGGATQSFQHTGQRYGHLLDPRIGWPAQGLLTATALAPTAAEADALATAFFVMGTEATGRYCDLHPQVSAVLVRSAGDSGPAMVETFGIDAQQWTRFV